MGEGQGPLNAACQGGRGRESGEGFRQVVKEVGDSTGRAVSHALWGDELGGRVWGGGELGAESNGATCPPPQRLKSAPYLRRSVTTPPRCLSGASDAVRGLC